MAVAGRPGPEDLLQEVLQERASLLAASWSPRRAASTTSRRRRSNFSSLSCACWPASSPISGQNGPESSRADDWSARIRTQEPPESAQEAFFRGASGAHSAGGPDGAPGDR